MKLLPLLLFVCFVLYEVLQVEGKSKHNAVKKLLQKYIHHHKHHHHHHHHHHKHHVHHHHYHHHHHKHHHHKHHHHHHHHKHLNHHHKSFHQKLVEKLKKEKLRQHHQQNVVKATKRESLPELLVSLGKGFMNLGRNLGKNESHADVQATKASAIKHVPTPKPLVHDYVATTQAAARAFATPSPTSEYHNENDDSDDIGRDALTSAPTTPTVSQKVTSNQYEERTGPRHKNIDLPIITPTPQPSPTPKSQATSDDISTSLKSDSPQLRKQERISHHKNVDSPTVASTLQSESSPSPSPSPIRDDFSPGESDEKDKTLNSTTDAAASRISKPNQDPFGKPKMAPSLDKENESVSSKDELHRAKVTDENRDSSNRAKGIDGHRDGSKPKIPGVLKEESIPNPSIEIPADQARLLEHSPTESAIDGREEDESFHSEQESRFVNSTSSENPSPNLFVSESSTKAENLGRLEMNATQSADQVVEPVSVEDDLSSNDETRGATTLNTPESLNEAVPAPGSFNKVDGEQTREAFQPNSENKSQVVEARPEDSQSEENTDGNLSVASERNLNTESKTEVNSTASDEITDGEVSPSEIIAENVDDLSSKSSTLSQAANGLKSSTESTDRVAMPSSQDSDSTTDKSPVKPATTQDPENTLDGTTQTSSQDSDSTTDKSPVKPVTSQDSENTLGGTAQASSQDADHEVVNQASQETSGNMGGTSQSTSPFDDGTTGKSLSTESDGMADQTKMSQPTTSSDDDSATTSESDSTTPTSHDDQSTAKSLFAKSDSTTGQLMKSQKSQSGITNEELAKPSTQETDGTDEEAQPTSHPVKTSDESVQASIHGADDITGGVNNRPSHDAEAFKDGSGTSEDARTSDLDDGKNAAVAANLQPSNQHSESVQDAPQLSPFSNSTLAVGDSEHSISDDVSTQPNPWSKSTETSSQSDSQSDDVSTSNPQSKIETPSLSSSQSDDVSTSNPQSKIETPSLSSSQSDDVVGGSSKQAPAPVYQNYTTLGSQENDDTAQSSEVPIDEAYIPTAEHLVDDTTQDDQNKVTNKVNSFPSEIVDGEVLPPNTALYNTEGFNTYNSTVPAIYN